ncbi:L-2-hydroxyglutarate dehydrogenase isoform X3 [Lycorma delicatula]|uniref:L-2-hydroxyglutarate dehydrogenase isoform X3 n=1 Tax=Lycorma delicatula TaxID=130591 RepID=UPI003F5133B4
MFSLRIIKLSFKIYTKPNINFTVHGKKLLPNLNGATFSQACPFSTEQTKDLFTLVIVGGGIIGLATAQEILTRMPTLSVALVEKEKQLATHQTGHNSGIVDWAEVARKYGSEFERMGGKIYRDFEVTSFTEIKQGVGIRKKSADYPILVKSKNAKMIRAKYVLTCAGLFADRVAEMTGEKTGLKIIPFRGEYLVLKKNKEHLCKGNIYPVPDPRFPFLGVHFTPRMNGTIWLGPNAILAFKREGYSFSDISLHDLADTLSFQGFRKFLMKNFGAAISELQNSIIFYRIQELQKYMPELSTNDVKKGPSGVRAQAMGADGSLIEDFVFSGKGNILHALNCPSPGATSSLAIGRELATKAQSQFGLK